MTDRSSLDQRIAQLNTTNQTFGIAAAMVRPTSMVFNSASGEQLGRLVLDSDEIKFVGNADAAAKEFFNVFAAMYRVAAEDIRRVADERDALKAEVQQLQRQIAALEAHA